MNKTTTALLAISLFFPCVHGAQSLMQVSGCEPGKLSAMSDGAFSKIDWFFSARIEKIRATPNMKVPEGAPCRYLSEKGNDAADGLTPATAWRTTKRLGAEELAPGTFVLFERGSLFRGAKRPTRYGNGVEIYGGCDGYTIDNCYVHDVYDAGIAHQYDMRSWKGGDPILMKNVFATRDGGK